MNGAIILINFCSLGFKMTHSFGKVGRDLFRNLKQQSHELITPSNLNTLLIPKTRSTFHESPKQEHKFQTCVCVH